MTVQVPVASPEPAMRRIEAFRQRFGEPHWIFACHAAVPLVLTVELLYELWNNFQRDEAGTWWEIPWVAVADLLVAGWLEEVGPEIYEMNPAVRAALLLQLRQQPNFGPGRLQAVARFLLEAVQPQLQSADLDLRDGALAQRWAALVWLQPQATAQELVHTLARNQQQGDDGELLRLAGLVQVLAAPLVAVSPGQGDLGTDWEPLQRYARGLSCWVRQDYREASRQFRWLQPRGGQVQVANLLVALPTNALLRNGHNWSRRRMLRLLLLAGAGGSAALLGQRWWASQIVTPADELVPPVAKQEQRVKLPFEVVRVNAQGKEIERRGAETTGLALTLAAGLDLLLVEIPAGKFLMGAPEDEEGYDDTEGPQHEVSVSAFLMGRTPVTQAQWRAVATGWEQVERKLEADPSHFKGDDRPVEQVSWYDAVEFCARLSRGTGQTYRLPSEAEWEYACRAGTTTPFHFGETITTDLANYRGTDDERFGWSGSYGDGPKGIYREGTTLVGTFPANDFGLQDMHGNVWEWCADHWHGNYQGAPTDGTAWLSSDESTPRLLRSGSWSNSPRDCRSALRVNPDPAYRTLLIGFRVVRAAARTL